jgi:ubiquinone/menaquinone biosynthesis C-methylase UbiE
MKSCKGALTMMHRNHSTTTTGSVLHHAVAYDLLAWLFTRGNERAFRERMAALARLKAGESVLDVGCGTGTLAITAKRLVGPQGTVHGIDASPEMIARARRKAAKAGVEVIFENAVAESLPFSDARFDVVFTSMMLHHLPGEARRQCLREIRRVLKPGGRLLAVDFGGPERQRHGLIARFHHHRHSQFDLRTVVPMMQEAGLQRVGEGAIGLGGLQFVFASPDPQAWAGETFQVEECDQPRIPQHRHWWLLLLLGVSALLAAHVVPLYYGLSRAALPAAVVSGAVVLVLIKHLGLLAPVLALGRRRPKHSTTHDR